MYTSLKNVQITICLLKLYHVRHVVLSPGGCDYPIIRSIECDEDFICHSVVDESSSAYFACGLSDELGEIVAIVCTSGTASINFISGIRWAYDNKKRIVAITADRDPFLLGQMETQKIDQMSAYYDCTCANVELPHVSGKREFSYCERVINECFMKMNENNEPIHINIPTTLGSSLCVEESLPPVRKIECIDKLTESIKNELLSEIQRFKRIIVIAGQSTGLSEEASSALFSFIKNSSAVLAVDHLSNIEDSDNVVYYYRVSELIDEKEFDSLCPDLVITFGNNYAGERIKRLLRNRSGRVVHWAIDSKRRIRDTFYCLRRVFVCGIDEFFSFISIPDLNRDPSFLSEWKRWEKKIHIDSVPYSNFLVAKTLCETVPENTNVYLSILMATRQTQFFTFNHGVKVYSNVGALGIDGCASTFMGGSFSTGLCYFLVGDLSLFYDINSCIIRRIPNNVRIIVVNNHCGGEFHFSSSNTSKIDIDNYVAAGHDNGFSVWAQYLGMDYRLVTNDEELKDGFEYMREYHDRPVFLEIITNADEDARITRQIYERYSKDSRKRAWIKRIRKFGNRLLGEKRIMRLYRIIKKV